MIFNTLCKRLLASKIRGSIRYFHASSTNYKIVQFLLSDIGEGIREVTISEWFVKVGDKVSQFDNICLVESDKASVSISSRYDGTIMKLYHNVGDKALVGKPLVDIDTSDGSDSSSDSEGEEVVVLEKDEKLTLEIKSAHDVNSIFNKSLATPAVRRIAMENNITLSNVTGSGKAGRVLKEDILNYLNLNAPTELVSASKVSEVTPTSNVTPITGIKRVMFNTMTQSNLIPSFNFYEEINVTELVFLKKELQSHSVDKKLKLTYMPFFIKALSKALLEYPELNSSIDAKQENVIRNPNHNVGFAVDSKVGLVVPNVKNVQNLTVLNVAKEINRILEKGKEGLFSPSDLQGGSITISNVGNLGGTYTRPLILPPELVIVALGKIAKRPIFNENNELINADILFSSWTADHRVIDGATLARFVARWKFYLENPNVLMFDL